jgi:hypothetical protein
MEYLRCPGSDGSKLDGAFVGATERLGETEATESTIANDVIGHHIGTEQTVLRIGPQLIS